MQEIITLVHSTLFDMIILGLPAIIYVIKIIHSPSKLEADVLTKLLLPLISYLSTKLANLHTNHNIDTSSRLNKVASDVNNLKAAISKNRKALG